jgi:hypothetical protein
MKQIIWFIRYPAFRKWWVTRFKYFINPELDYERITKNV